MAEEETLTLTFHIDAERGWLEAPVNLVESLVDSEISLIHICPPICRRFISIRTKMHGCLSRLWGEKVSDTLLKKNTTLMSALCRICRWWNIDRKNGQSPHGAGLEAGSFCYRSVVFL